MLVAVVVSIIGYPLWVYSGWIEYRLICTDSSAVYIEITKSPTPELLTAIHKVYDYPSLSCWAGSNEPFRWDGDILFMRPWFYLLELDLSIKRTRGITHRALGGEFSDPHEEWLGSTCCWELYENGKLFQYDPNNDHPTEYIRSQDYYWLLTTIAPPPPMN